MSSKDTCVDQQLIDGLIDRPDLQSRWLQIQKNRQQLATRLKRLASQFYGIEKSQLASWSEWFRREQDLRIALCRPDILTLVVPLFQSADSNGISETELEKFSQRSVQYANFTPSVSRRLWRAIRYPIALVFVLAVMWFCFICTLAPEIRSLFLDFGLELPVLAQLLLGELPYLHRFSWVLAGLVFVVAIWVSVQNIIHRYKAPNSNWLDRQLMSNRCAMGIWAWHVALLMHIGFQKTEAIRISSVVTSNSWIRKQWQRWKSDSPDLKSTPLFLDLPFPMVSRAINRETPEKQIPLLECAAKYYLDRDRTISDWWFRILAWLIVWNIFVALSLLVF
ncbi:MAG: hypothetical protein AAGA30_07030, partial [Planctomycetota bacterium]